MKEQVLIDLVKTAVELAILRHDLCREGSLGECDAIFEEDRKRIAEDAANAVQGIETCVGTPVPQWTAALEALK